jgi:UDP-3-O-[3-hydroxymyristoyl] glucosamine N-acyltransferase
MELTLLQLAERLEASVVGCGDNDHTRICAVGPVESAQKQEVTFVADDRHAAAAAKSAAGAVIVAKCIKGVDKPQLVVKDVNAALIQALNIFAPKLKPPQEGIDPSAKLGRNVRIGKGSSIGPHVVIDDNVEIGDNTVIGSGTRIGENSKLGGNCRLDSNVVIYHNCALGNNVIVQANTTIGSVGFGYCFIDGAHRLVPHNGGVIIEDFVEIGANCCVDRAKFGNTIVGAGTKIDNLVQVAHNVVIGKCCLISAHVGVAGSCKVGDGVVLAGQVGLADNIEVGAGTIVGAQAGVMQSVPPGQKLAWTPAIDVREAMRVVAQVIRLPKLTEQFKQLTKRVDKLEAADDHKQ